MDENEENYNWVKTALFNYLTELFSLLWNIYEADTIL